LACVSPFKINVALPEDEPGIPGGAWEVFKIGIHSRSAYRIDSAGSLERLQRRRNLINVS
jgi:hypothetical protein